MMIRLVLLLLLLVPLLVLADSSDSMGLMGFEPQALSTFYAEIGASRIDHLTSLSADLAILETGCNSTMQCNAATNGMRCPDNNNALTCKNGSVVELCEKL